MRTLMTAIVLVGALAGCGATQAGNAESQPDSGVRGLAIVDIGCPVVRAGSACPTKPVNATVTVHRSGSSAPVAQVQTGEDGGFTVPLHPGQYIVTATAKGFMPMRQTMQRNVTITAGAWTQVKFHFDSGIRVPEPLVPLRSP